MGPGWGGKEQLKNKKMKTTKYNYINVIQQHYGNGWEDVSEYPAKSNGLSIDAETKALLKHDLAEYRLTGYSTRVIFRKEPNLQEALS